MSLNRRHVVAAAAAGAMLIVPLGASGAVADDRGPDRPHYTLTILHNNDGESRLTGGPEFGGVARFATLVDDLRTEATTGKPGPGQAGRRGVVLLSSGDNFLAGPEFQASLDKGVPFYDSIALSRIGYDAFAIGNHEFDFGPDVLADFIDGFGSNPPPFLSANLDVSDEPRLAALADDGTIVASTVVRERGARIGVVGATTPLLPAISSPRNVKVFEDVAGLIQAQVDNLTDRGVNKIVLISHLQSINEDLELIPMLRDIDVAIAGGGDELLANEDDVLIPGDERATGPDDEPLTYPIFATDDEGKDVPIVTTSGDYEYVGRLVVNFDRDGEVLGTDEVSGPVRVSGVAPDAVEPDEEIQRDVVDPVNEFIADLAENVIATSDVELNGVRESVRTEETNLGNLVADALRDAGTDNAADFGVTEPDVAIQNGGGIRNSVVIPAGGEITELDTFSIAPFPNFVSVVPGIQPAQFKEIVENMVSNVENVDGRFGQVSGFSFTWDAARTAQEVDNDGNVLTPGDRVRELTLDDDTVIVEDGEVVDGAPAVAIATNDFSARGGDQYPFRGADFTTVGVTYQQALAEYLVEDLGALVTADAYPEGGEGRITRLN